MRNCESPTVLQALNESTGYILSSLIGDTAYLLTPYCMKEYDHCSTNEKVFITTCLGEQEIP